MNEKKLFLLDAYALIYRAYYAMMRSPRFTTKGVNTSAVFGFVNTLDDLLRKECPTHIAVCFDPKGGHTFRHELYPEYKAQRDKQPEDITIAVPYIKAILEAMKIRVIEVEGYEADDVIGTLAHKARSEGYTTYMMTPDKDYGQLVTDGVYMYRPALKGRDFEIRGVKEVCERYGIERTSQVIDLLALEGDASDNVPGCPGVGEKTARKLIEQFGSVEKMLEDVDQIKGALRQKIADNAEQILFSKLMVTIKTDVPIDIDFSELGCTTPDYKRLREIYSELEFKSFIAKLPGEAGAAPAPPKPAVIGSLFDFDNAAEVQPAAPAATENVVVETITGADEVAALVSILKGKTFAISTNAPGDEAMTAPLQGLAISSEAGKATYVSLPADADRRAALIAALKPLFADADSTLVSLDVKRDMILLRNEGIDVATKYFDVAIAHYLLQSEMRHNLEDIALGYMNLSIAPLSTVARTRYPAIDAEAAPAIFGRRAAVLLQLREPLEKAVKEENMESLMRDIELPLVRVLAEMEWVGARIDEHELAELSKKFSAILQQLTERCYELAGHPFNVGSPRQVGEVLFAELKLDPSAKRTKSGSYSTSEDILEKLAHDNEIVEVILKIRTISKLLATYVDALPKLVNPRTGKIHTTYNQTVASTGRISSANPNLQNIPVRTNDGRDVRRAFIPDPGNLLLAADYSQIELRLMADMSGDPDMLSAFEHGNDIHRATAAKIYHEPLENVTDTQRRNAKTANFGIIYGISAFGLSERLGIPRSEAKMLIDGYFSSYPHIREYIDEAKEKARENGYVETLMGRRRRLPDINSRNAVVRNYAERNAVNAPIQGTAADIIKLAMVRIFNQMKQAGFKSQMIMQVHDELIFNVVPDELPALQKLVVTEMENAYSGRVRLEVSAGTATNWAEAH